MIDNYLDNTADNTQTNVSFERFEQCTIGRQEHVCNLNQEESQLKVDIRGRTLEREVTHKIELIDSDED